MDQRYELFNEILFDSYCKTCISNAILKERERKSARLQAATPFSSFPAEFLSMIPQPEMEEDDDSDDYCLVTMGKKRIRVKSRTLGQALLSLLPKDREIVMRYYGDIRQCSVPLMNRRDAALSCDYLSPLLLL